MSNFNNIILLSFSTIIGGIINYIYHPIMLKFLDLDTFAEFESLVSVFNILGVLVGGISFFLLKEISKNSKDLVKIKSIFIYSNKFLLISSVIIYLIFVLFSPILSNFLKIKDLLPLNIIGITITISFLSVVINPILQGLEKFKTLAFFSVLGSIIKLFIGVLFVFLGFSLYGAIAGFIISGVLITIISFLYIYKLFYNVDLDNNVIKNIKTDFKKEKKDIFYSFLLVFLLSFYMNLDIILAKNLFDNNIAGIYSGISVIAKFIIFLGGSIETVYYPQIIKGDKIQAHFIRNGVGMITILGLGSIGFISLFGNFFLETIKKGFGEYNNMLILLIIYCIIYTFISFFTKILVGFKKYSINYVLIAGILSIFFASKYFSNGNINSFMYTFIGVGTSLVFIMLFMIISLIRKNNF